MERRAPVSDDEERIRSHPIGPLNWQGDELASRVVDVDPVGPPVLASLHELETLARQRVERVRHQNELVSVLIPGFRCSRRLARTRSSSRRTPRSAFSPVSRSASALPRRSSPWRCSASAGSAPSSQGERGPSASSCLPPERGSAHFGATTTHRPRRQSQPNGNLGHTRANASSRTGRATPSHWRQGPLRASASLRFSLGLRPTPDSSSGRGEGLVMERRRSVAPGTTEPLPILTLLVTCRQIDPRKQQETHLTRASRDGAGRTPSWASGSSRPVGAWSWSDAR